MKMKKSTLSLALATALCASTAQADLYDMTYEGLFTWAQPDGLVLQNTSNPYYSDPTWGYGRRTQISGSLQIDTDTGFGLATVNPFEFINGGPAVISNFELMYASSTLLIGNMTFDWNGSSSTTQIVFDASGLFVELPTAQIGDTYNANTCLNSGACTLPASNDSIKGNFPIGPVPVATSSFNTNGQTGYGTTLSQLSLGIDDGIGGSPNDNGPFTDFYNNFDITSLTVVDIVPSPVPVPAAVWLFGSGLIGLAGVAKRRQKK